ncbi:antitoxin VapB [Rhizobium leguminosarum]|uniref:AbrB/MazE/SpoVT family DNA-binding domain-containing protein n=1 Tax=Rhizobium leguminosarum TaxID=384 RepID=UPI001620B640|nr:AbrB/MazE/SpoVT family DNA-binding domain-containing protein [Rhizobium leguminosarum]MBB5663686.1 antitoxin VapB [Rhizobium leguminosarum]
MHRTKVFKNGNSQAVRIPADLAYSQTEMDLEIERIGDELRIRLLKPSLQGISRVSRGLTAHVRDFSVYDGLRIENWLLS